MAWYEWILSFLLFIVSLGMLVTIHEAGHFSTAKLFNVYCREFSIGFGPALLKRRKEGKETYFSIRAIPLGGYVSMFGEDDAEIEEFKDLPRERSIEGIKKWKKIIIVSAGVILNAILALILIGVSDIAFPIVGMTSRMIVESGSVAEEVGLRTDDRVQFLYPSAQESENGIAPFVYEFTDNEKVIHGGSFFIVDTEVEMNEKHYVLGFMFQGDKGNPSFTSGLKLYQGIAKADLLKHEHVNEMFKDWALEEGSPEYYPNFEESTYHFDETQIFNATVTFLDTSNDTTFIKTIQFTGENKAIKDIGIKFQTSKIWLPFGTRIKNTFIDYGNASVAVFKGIGTLFTGGIKNMSGIVGIFETSASLYSNYTFATYLYFWGLISVNLAIFNLLPFPGLDGWQILVTVIEGITHKKIPSKLKGIMSFIGLAILMLLMIVIVVLDVVRIVGV